MSHRRVIRLTGIPVRPKTGLWDLLESATPTRHNETFKHCLLIFANKISTPTVCLVTTHLPLTLTNPNSLLTLILLIFFLCYLKLTELPDDTLASLYAALLSHRFIYSCNLQLPTSHSILLIYSVLSHLAISSF